MCSFIQRNCFSCPQNIIQSRTNGTFYPVSHMVTSSSLQSSIISRLSQLKKRQGGGSSRRFASQRNTFLLDDIHLASRMTLGDESYENAKHLVMADVTSLTETMSMIAEHQALPDIARDHVHSLKGVRWLVTSTGVGAKKLPMKLLRQLNIVPFFPLSDHGLEYVTQKRLLSWTNKFNLEVDERNTALCKVEH